MNCSSRLLLMAHTFGEGKEKERKLKLWAGQTHQARCGPSPLCEAPANHPFTDRLGLRGPGSSSARWAVGDTIRTAFGDDHAAPSPEPSDQVSPAPLGIPELFE